MFNTPVMTSMHHRYSVGWFWTVSQEPHELYKGTNNTPVNTCLLIIFAEKSTPLILQNLLYIAVSLH